MIIIYLGAMNFQHEQHTRVTSLQVGHASRNSRLKRTMEPNTNYNPLLGRRRLASIDVTLHINLSKGQSTRENKYILRAQLDGTIVYY